MLLRAFSPDACWSVGGAGGVTQAALPAAALLLWGTRVSGDHFSVHVGCHVVYVEIPAFDTGFIWGALLRGKILSYFLSFRT